MPQVEKILGQQTAPDVCEKAKESYMNSLEITTDYIFEKLAEALEVREECT